MQSSLTTRELQVLRLITLGYSNSQIAKILSITLHTVKAHVQAILYKLQVKNRVQAAVVASKYLIGNNNDETIVTQPTRVDYPD